MAGGFNSKGMFSSNRGSQGNLLMMNKADDYQGFQVTATGKQLHSPAPVKLRSYSTLGHTGADIMNRNETLLGGTLQPQKEGGTSRNPKGTHHRTNSGVDATLQGMRSMSEHQNYPPMDAFTMKKSDSQFGIDGYLLPGTMHDIIKVPKWQ